MCRSVREYVRLIMWFGRTVSFEAPARGRKKDLLLRTGIQACMRSGRQTILSSLLVWGNFVYGKRKQKGKVVKKCPSVPAYQEKFGFQ